MTHQRALRVTMLVPGLEVSGGMRVLFEYANRLHRRGHAVTLVCPATLADEGRDGPGLRDRLARWGRSVVAPRRVAWFDLGARLMIVPSLAQRHVPDADVTVATFWRTAEALADYGPRAGAPLYFVQGHEVWAGERERVEATYGLPMPKLVVASWLKRMLRERFGEDAWGPMISGVNLEQFHNDDKVFHDPPAVGMLYRPTIWRGTEAGLRAVELARRRHPRLRLVMFGQSWPGLEVPEGTEYHRDPSQSALASIYGRCDIWMNPSWHEGLPLPPMEAMACRCAVVTTDVGVDDYVEPGRSALVVPPRDAEALAAALCRLIEDARLLRAISDGGWERIRTFTWDRAVEGFEAALFRAADA